MDTDILFSRGDINYISCIYHHVGNPASKYDPSHALVASTTISMPPQLPYVPLISNTLHSIVATHPFLIPSLSYHVPLFVIL